MAWLASLAWIPVAVLLGVVLWRALFSLAYLIAGRARPALPECPETRFAVVIPAHDEELLIADVVDSIRAADYPEERIAIHVIADNCTDQTAERARQRGAKVEVRRDPDGRGKGQALAWMFERLDLSNVDAVALFDADNLVQPEFFRAMDRELRGGGRCLQGYYDIANPGDSIFTRLMAVTYVMKNLLLNGGKAVLGLSVILMGTGMVFRREVIEEGGWDAMSIGEDLEQSLSLLERGERIRFVADARTRAQEATSLRQGYTQRQRWATGRRSLQQRARRLLVRGLRGGSLNLVDGCLDLLMPSYSKLLNWSLLVTGLVLLLAPASPGLVWVMGGVLLWQVLEIAVALILMRASPRFVAALVFAPVYLVWKAGIDALALVGHRRDAWTRTDRTLHSKAGPTVPETQSAQVRIVK